MVDLQPAPLWQIDIAPADGQVDRRANEIANDARELDLADSLQICCLRGFLIQGHLDRSEVESIARQLLVEAVVEQCRVDRVGQPELSQPPNGKPVLIHVLPKPGVTDPEAESTLRQVRSLGHDVSGIRTFKKYWIEPLPDEQIHRLTSKLLSNESIDQVIAGPLKLARLDVGDDYPFELQTIQLTGSSDEQLQRISREGGLSLTLIEMRTIQEYFRKLGREPTDIELETIAQTWSEHCSHKTLAGKVFYRDESGCREFQNLLKETIFAATHTIRQQLQDDDWCVSVFRDNAGIVRFDEDSNVTFKVETHNRPSAIEPYGGANTGIGGVIRDTLGTGLGAKPVCSTDVFCFAPPDLPAAQLPPSVLHPRRIMKGVVAGVRDYGNRMGIPTVNGAIYFDRRYVGNPLVFCGNVGVVPHDLSFKQPQPDDLIVAVGGPTGRDGIHGATFSSAELTEHSEKISGGAVQIGNAITEKMLLDVLLQARDRGLYHAVTDCGAGGFSSAVGEMGADIGAEVWLDKAPLKYRGLSYTEIWISEAQERMVLAIPEKNWREFEQLCRSESVEATVIGKFVATGQLELTFEGQRVGCLDMEFMHDGRPDVLRDAVYLPPAAGPLESASSELKAPDRLRQSLLDILASPNVCSKHWVIRQYDHEVLGGSVIKPLVGAENYGPSDAAVIRPKLKSHRGLVIACGMNPHYGDWDPYHMAASSIDEAVRNCVAVGADPRRIAVLDNFCWGYTDRPETLGSLVRAAIACHDVAVAFGTPFISGKDSLNNEFSYRDANGNRQTISIPSTLLISGLGQVDDVRRCVTMDFKQPGNDVYLVGQTYDELGGSHFGLVNRLAGGMVPRVRTSSAVRIFEAVHSAISQGCVRACHDLSEGGLAVAAAEMAIAGALGVSIHLNAVEVRESHGSGPTVARLFSESNTRFLLEAAPGKASALQGLFAGLPFQKIGQVTADREVRFEFDSDEVVIPVSELKFAWRAPLDWS